MLRGFLPLATIACMLAVSACSRDAGPKGNPEENLKSFELHEIGSMYKLYFEDKGKPPAKLSDVESFEPGFPVGYQALAKGACVAVWGVDLKTAPGDRVLAYQKNTPTEGGLVVLVDQSIKKMTADEFKTAKR